MRQRASPAGVGDLPQQHAQRPNVRLPCRPDGAVRARTAHDLHAVELYEGKHMAVAARRCMAPVVADDLQSTTMSQTMGLTGAKKPSARREDLEVISLG